MKGFKKFNMRSATASTVASLVGGAGSAVADWLLDKYGVMPADWAMTTQKAVKVAVGAVVGSVAKNNIVKSAFDGIATVAAASIITDLLPEAEKTNSEAPAGLAKGTIGRLGYRMGQPGFRRSRVAGVAGEAGAFMSK